VFVVVKPSCEGFMLDRFILDGKTGSTHVMEFVSKLAEENVGEHGYGDVGAVIAGNLPQAQYYQWYRKAFPKVYFLIPGVGVQGGNLDYIKEVFDKGFGGIINVSRSILYGDDEDWRAGILDRVLSLKEKLKDV